MCRSPAAGYKNASREAWNKLSTERVKCVESSCSWTGVLREYRRHMRNKHQTYLYSNLEGSTTLPALPTRSQVYETGRSVVANQPRVVNQGWHRLEFLMESFTEQLEMRRQNVERAYQEQEQARREQLREAECIGRQLGKVATDLSMLIDNMSRDTRRFQSYISSDTSKQLTPESATTSSSRGLPSISRDILAPPLSMPPLSRSMP